MTLNRNAYKEKGGAYRTYGKEERCVQGFGGKTCGKGTLNKWEGEAWTGLVWTMIGTGGRRL